jgi:hypothetical protein
LDRELPPTAKHLTAHSEHVPDEIDLRIALRRPLDGKLPHSIARPLSPDQQFGIEEPVIVLDVAEKGIQRLAIERLEPTLVIANVRPEHGPNERVVRPARDAPLSRTLRDVAGHPPRAGRDLRLARSDGLDQLFEVGHVRRQVRIEVGERPAAGGTEGPPQCAPAPESRLGVNVANAVVLAC